jgi:hypothetical protein
MRVPDLRILTKLNALRTVIRAESSRPSSPKQRRARRRPPDVLDARYRTWEQFDKTWKALLATKRHGVKEEQLLDVLRGTMRRGAGCTENGQNA